jgi:hypothetical protein
MYVCVYIYATFTRRAATTGNGRNLPYVFVYMYVCVCVELATAGNIPGMYIHTYMHTYLKYGISPTLKTIVIQAQMTPDILPFAPDLTFKAVRHTYAHTIHTYIHT